MRRTGSICTRAAITALVLWFLLASAEHHGNLEDPTLLLELQRAKARIGELKQALHECGSALNLLSRDEDGADKMLRKWGDGASGGS